MNAGMRSIIVRSTLRSCASASARLGRSVPVAPLSVSSRMCSGWLLTAPQITAGNPETERRPGESVPASLFQLRDFDLVEGRIEARALGCGAHHADFQRH